MNVLLIDPSESVSNLVLSHSECGEVLRRHRIDYSRRGQRSIEDVALERDIDVEALAQELLAAICDHEAQNLQDPRDLSSQDLVAYIVEKHHAHQKETLPLVGHLAVKVAGAHGAFDPALHSLVDAVDELAETLTAHIEKEADSLFPLLLASSSDDELLDECARSIVNEHSDIATQLSQVREHSRDFRIPEWACASYRTLIAELEHLEADVFSQLHIENHVLFPRFLRDRAGDDCTRLFKKEHARFSALLALLEEQLGPSADGNAVDYELVLDIFEYLSDFADRYHHPLEGRVFALVSEREPKVNAFVVELKRKHRAISELGATLVSSLRSALNDTVVSRDSVTVVAGAYVYLFREHMALEEEHLFDLVAALSCKPSWLVEELSTRKNPLFGEQVEERFRSLRRRLINSAHFAGLE